MPFVRVSKQRSMRNSGSNSISRTFTIGLLWLGMPLLAPRVSMDSQKTYMKLCGSVGFVSILHTANKVLVLNFLLLRKKRQEDWGQSIYGSIHRPIRRRPLHSVFMTNGIM